MVTILDSFIGLFVPFSHAKDEYEGLSSGVDYDHQRYSLASLIEESKAPPNAFDVAASQKRRNVKRSRTLAWTQSGKWGK